MSSSLPSELPKTVAGRLRACLRAGSKQEKTLAALDARWRALPNASRVVNIWQMYHNASDARQRAGLMPEGGVWRHLRLDGPPLVEPSGRLHVSLSELYPVFKNKAYQRLWSEFSGILALVNTAEGASSNATGAGGCTKVDLLSADWIGFESWKIGAQGRDPASLRKRKVGWSHPVVHEDVVEFGKHLGPDRLYFWFVDRSGDPLLDLAHVHGARALSAMKQAFSAAHRKKFPRLYPHPYGAGYSFKFLLPRHLWFSFLRFARPVAERLDEALLEAESGRMLDGSCPVVVPRTRGKKGTPQRRIVKMYNSPRCLGYFTERLINVWAQLSGVQMIAISGVGPLTRARHSERLWSWRHVGITRQQNMWKDIVFAKNPPKLSPVS
eukprot:gene11945-14108_t